jgi:DNA-binding NtrC family response regulator
MSSSRNIYVAVIDDDESICRSLSRLLRAAHFDPITYLSASASASERSLTLRDAEREHIGMVLEMTGRRIRGRGGAAEVLGMKPSTLRSLMAKLGLQRPLFSQSAMSNQCSC